MVVALSTTFRGRPLFLGAIDKWCVLDADWRVTIGGDSSCGGIGLSWLCTTEYFLATAQDPDDATDRFCDDPVDVEEFK